MPHLPLPTTQIRHPHDLNDKTRPAREMLRALPLARLRIILLPREARLLPALEYCLDEVEAKARVQVFGFFLVWAGGLRVFLDKIVSEMDGRRKGCLREAARLLGSSCSSIRDRASSSRLCRRTHLSCSDS